MENIIEDEIVYHYTSREIAIEYILNKMSLRASPLNKTEDPKEYKKRIVASFGLDKEGQHKQVSEYLNEVVRKHSKVISFCRSKNGNEDFHKGYGKVRMWAQYGGVHRGVCLGINKRKFLESIKNNKNLENFLTGNVIYNNNYKENVEIIDGLKDKFADEISLKKSTKKHILNKSKKILFRKDLDWRDENEFRIVLINEKEDYEYVDISDSLESVYLGIEFPEVYIPLVKEILKDKAVKLYQMKYEIKIYSKQI